MLYLQSYMYSFAADNEFFHYFLPCTDERHTKLAENLWNTFERLPATWISVEPRSLLVARHDPSTFQKLVVKMLPIFGTARKV